MSKLELLNQKLDNMCNYLSREFPNVKLKLTQLKTQSLDLLITFIVVEVKPHRNNLSTVVDDICKIEKIKVNDEQRQKLIKYLNFFCDITD